MDSSEAILWCSVHRSEASGIVDEELSVHHGKMFCEVWWKNDISNQSCEIGTYELRRVG